MNPAYHQSVFIPLLRHIFGARKTPFYLNDIQRRLLATATTDELMEFVLSYMVEYAVAHPDAPPCIRGLLPNPYACEMAFSSVSGADHPPVDALVADADSAAVDSPENGFVPFLMVDGGTSPS